MAEVREGDARSGCELESDEDEDEDENEDMDEEKEEEDEVWGVVFSHELIDTFEVARRSS